MTRRFISLFSGGGGADLGATLAGYTPIAANEYDANIAAVYAQNIGAHVRVGDILTQDPRDYPACELLHASPPCPNFSVAKRGATETAHDIALAEKVAEFIRVLSPNAVTIENVPAYRKSQSYAILISALMAGGYWYDAQVLNAADFGVPQTRRRLIVRASKSMVKPLPEKTQWVGWYEAIADLIPTLPDSQFAAWQLKRLPQAMTSFLIPAGGHGGRGGGAAIPQDLPHATLRSTQTLSSRAFMLNKNTTERDDYAREAMQPAYTMSANEDGRRRALLESGRVVKMTTRALARFQSFPDTYALPDKTALACRIIGNAVPPLMYAAIAKSLTP